MTGNVRRAASATSFSRRLPNNGSAATMSAPACSWARESKTASNSSSEPAFRIGSCTPFVRAASCTPPIMCALVELFGFNEETNHPRLRNQLRYQLKTLGRQLDGKEADAREIPAGMRQAVAKAGCARVASAD